MAAVLAHALSSEHLFVFSRDPAWSSSVAHVCRDQTESFSSDLTGTHTLHGSAAKHLLKCAAREAEWQNPPQAHGVCAPEGRMMRSGGGGGVMKRWGNHGRRERRKQRSKEREMSCVRWSCSSTRVPRNTYVASCMYNSQPKPAMMASSEIGRTARDKGWMRSPSAKTASNGHARGIIAKCATQAAWLNRCVMVAFCRLLRMACATYRAGGRAFLSFERLSVAK